MCDGSSLTSVRGTFDIVSPYRKTCPAGWILTPMQFCTKYITRIDKLS